ncbi:MAG: glycoside hydrolase family 13 protein [Candidatus Eremiobacterota bacterium]
MRQPPPDTPDWVRDTVFYQIFPDRFARSGTLLKPANLEPWDSPPTPNGFKGGDLEGVIERLDYLQDLGVNGLYFCPIFWSAANHRYHTYDYYQVDPLLGGNRALERLLKECRQRNFRLVLDGVFNHASRGFFQFHDILENGPVSPYVDWFTVHGWPLSPYDESKPSNYSCWWGLPALPKFNTDNPAVREFLWGVGAHWVDAGIDGWRLDVPAEIDDDEFWREFRRRVRAKNRHAYLVGEIWVDARRWLQGDMFDGVMNYLWTSAVIGFCVKSWDRALTRKLHYGSKKALDARGFRAAVDKVTALYAPEVNQVQLNLLDSHDTPRFLTLAGGDAGALKLATLLQMCWVGAPCIYYGDEIGMQGGRDPDCRRSFPWEPERWDQELLATFRELIGLRHRHPSLRRGAFRPVAADGELFAFERELGDECLLVLANAGTGPARCTTARRGLERLYGDATQELTDQGTALEQPPRSGSVFQCH